jgi:O-antigen ligase
MRGQVGGANQLARGLSLYIAVAAVAVGTGLLVGRSHAAIAVGGALAGGVILVLAMQSLGFRSLTLWVVVGVVAYPFVRYPQGHSQLTFDRAWLIGMAGAMLVTAAPIAKRTGASRRMMLWLVFFSFAILLRGALTTTHRLYAIGLAVDGVVLPTILFVAARRMITTRGQWDRLAAAFAIAGAILGAVGVAERLLGFQLATLSGGTLTTAAGVGVRVSGPYATDDALAVALLMCFGATLLWVQSSPRARWVPGGSALAIEVAGIYLTFFRGAWIAAIVAFVLATGLRPRRYTRLVGILALVGALAAVLYVRAQDNNGLSQRLNNTQNVTGRLATYQQAVQLFAHHPVDGVGLGQFATAQQTELFPTSFAGLQAAAFAHDSYLDLLSEGGLLVFLPFLGVTVATGLLIHRFRMTARSDPYDILVGSMLVGAALAYLLMSLEETVITSSTASNAFFVLLLGACAGRLDALASGKGEPQRPPVPEAAGKPRDEARVGAGELLPRPTTEPPR